MFQGRPQEELLRDDGQPEVPSSQVRNQIRDPPEWPK